MEIEKKFPVTMSIVIAVLISLVFGVAGGYYLGNITGIEQGRQALLAEQVAVEAKKLEELSKEANPFSSTKDAANPFKDMYQNPFAE